MKSRITQLVSVMMVLAIGILTGYGCSESARQGTGKAQASKPEGDAAKPVKVQRFGSCIGLRSEKKERYNDLHAHPWPEITAMIKKCNIRNYSIYETEIDGKIYLFSYFEYVGDNFEADMAKMAADPKTKEWWKETDPCQERLPGTPEGKQWMEMAEVFHLD